MNKPARLLALLRQLPRKRGNTSSTAAALARSLGTTERTVYRDLAALEEAGICVANDGAGYYLLATDQTLLPGLSAEELLALTHAAQWGREVMLASAGVDVQPVLDKLASAGASQDLRRQAAERDPALVIAPHITDGPLGAHHLATALQARARGRQLRGVYCTPDRDDACERTLHPYAVVFRGQAHYLVARCELRDEVRTFRLDRFRSLAELEAPAEVPDGYDVEQHFLGAWEVVAGRTREIRLLLRGQACRRYRGSLLHPSQVVTRRAATELEFTLRVAISDEFVSWLLSMGPELVVLAPASLQRRLRALATEIAENYPQG